MIFSELPGFTPQLLHCSFGHNHGDPGQEVVGLETQRQSLGKERRTTFHCPDCSVVHSSMVRSELRRYPTIDAAMATGNTLPCGFCFRQLNAFFSDYVRRRSGQRWV
jgi:hypothetical protein